MSEQPQTQQGKPNFSPGQWAWHLCRIESGAGTKREGVPQHLIKFDAANSKQQDAGAERRAIVLESHLRPMTMEEARQMFRLAD